MSGTTPAILFLHGMFGSPENWRACAEHLAHRCTVLNPRLPIFDLPSHDASVEGLTEHARRLLDAAGVGRAVVAGNSLGGHIALRLALRDPDRVAALILTGSSGLMERGFDSAVPRRPGRDYLRRKIAEVFYDAGRVTDALIDDVSATVSEPRLARRLVVMAKSARRDNLRGALPLIHCPVLLIWGADDSITPPEVAREFLAGLPNAELRLIERCGHAPMMEQPDEFNHFAGLFLERVFDGDGAANADRARRAMAPGA